MLYHTLGYSVLILSPLAVGLAAAGKLIIHLWVGTQVQPTYSLLFGMALWTILTTVSIAIWIFLSGINELKFQALVSVLAALGSLALRIVLARTFGIVGVIWASTFALVVSNTVRILYIPRLLKKMDKLVPAP